MLDLESAIKHCEEVAEEQEKAAKELSEFNKNRMIDFCDKYFKAENECWKCAEEHRQLAEWLKELKKYREKDRYNNYDICLGGFHDD